MSDLEQVKLPPLIVIPAGSKPHQCGCKMWTYFAKHDGRTRIVSCGTLQTNGDRTFYSRKTKRDIPVPGIGPPTATADGLGFDHHIDCAQSEQWRKPQPRAPMEREPSDIVAKIAATEQLAQAWGIKCTGGPRVNDCNGDAVVAFLLGGKLFATPCSYHADRTKKAILDAGRGRDYTHHALEEFLLDKGARVAEQFAKKAAALRRWHTERGGITVPPHGHL